MKVISVVPVSGREPLLNKTIGRLINQCHSVVVAGHTESERIACKGAEFIMCDSGTPLGLKWNLCIELAMKETPDAILIMGSSDMISDNWIEELYPYLENYDMVGTSGIHFLDVQPHNRFGLYHWKGYTKDREGEPIGTGRLISARAIMKMGCKAFYPTINNSLDYSTMELLNFTGIKCLDYPLNSNVKALSISTFAWGNKHNFEGLRHDSASTDIQDAEPFVNEYFSDAANVFGR
jgi:hypothetical protein